MSKNVKQEVLRAPAIVQRRRRGCNAAGRGLTSRGPLRINWKGMKCQACFHHSETVKNPTSSSSSSPSRQLVAHQTFSPLTSRPRQPPTAMTKLLSSVQSFALQCIPDISMQNKSPSLATGALMRQLAASLCVAKQSVYFIWTMACPSAMFCKDPNRALGVMQVLWFDGAE